MLNLPISGVENLIFAATLFLWAILLFGGAIFGTPNDEKTRRMPAWTRLTSSFNLVIAAWIWFAVSQGTPVNVFTAWVAVGMTLGFIGDVFMASIFPIEPRVLYGMVAFGLGHIAYITGMWLFALPHDVPYPNIKVLLLWWLIAVLGWFLIVFRGSERNIMVYAALPYALLLATTAGFATSLTILDSTFSLVAIGTVLFLISDLILAAELFKNVRFKFIDDIVWLLYGPAQMLIVFGVIIFTFFTA